MLVPNVVRYIEGFHCIHEFVDGICPQVMHEREDTRITGLVLLVSSVILMCQSYQLLHLKDYTLRFMGKRFIVLSCSELVAACMQLYVVHE